MSLVQKYMAVLGRFNSLNTPAGYNSLTSNYRCGTQSSDYIDEQYASLRRPRRRTTKTTKKSTTKKTATKKRSYRRTRK